MYPSKNTLILECRDAGLIEKLEYSCVVALLGYSIMLAIIRSFGLRNDAARVMVAAPIIAFSTTHILFLCNYMMDYGIIIYDLTETPLSYLAFLTCEFCFV